MHEKNFVDQIKQITPLGKSDHNIIITDLNEFQEVQNKKVTVFKYKDANYRDLEMKLDKVDWDKLIESNSVDYAWNKLIKLLNDFRDNHIPRLSRDINKSKPWFTNEIKRSIKRRDNAFKRYRKTRLYYFMAKYNVARNIVAKIIQIVKCKYKRKIIKGQRITKKFFVHILPQRIRNLAVIR